jgi:hypothetical protein
MEIKRNDDAKRGPLDGIECETVCTVSKIRGRSASIDKLDARILCSVQTGVVTISHGKECVSVTLADMMQALEAAYQAAGYETSMVRPWIKCSERIPEHEEMVPVWTDGPDGGQVTIAWHCHSQERWAIMGDCLSNDVVAWQEMPIAPPRQEAEK